MVAPLIVGAAVGLVEKIGGALLNLIPDPEARQRATMEIIGVIQASDQSQAEINKEEAKNPSLFISGWRPAFGWMCVAAFAYTYIIKSIGVSILSIWKPEWATIVLNMPSLDNSMIELTFGLLGLSVSRSWEKAKGVASR